MTIPAAPAAPSRYAAEAWQAAYDDLDKEIDKWARRLANNKDPLTVSERNRLRVLTESVRNVTAMSGESAQVAAYAIDTTNNAARTSLQASLNALPEHVLATVAEDAADLGWANVANRDAMGAIVQGRTGQLTADFTSLTKDVQTRLISGLQTGVALGESPARTAKRLRDSINDPVRFGQGRSVMIARTQLARAYDQASRASYAIARQNGVVDAWEWQAFASACPICGELDGQVFDIEMDTYRHPNCRCAILPVLTDSAKAKQARFTGSDTLELRTSPSGWTHWAQKKGKGKTAKRRTPPKQPTAPTTAADKPKWRDIDDTGMARRDAVEKDLDDLLSPFVQEMGLRGGFSTTELGRDGGITYKYRVTDPKTGDVVFRLERTFIPETNTVKHDYMKLSPELQGQGFGTRINNSLYQTYREQGYEAVELVANVDVGGYTWARAGYGWRSIDGSKKFFQKVQDDWGDLDNVPDEWVTLYDRAMSAKTVDDMPLPIEIANIGRGTGNHWGKTVMLEARWAGRRLL